VRPFVFGLIHDEDLASIVAKNIGDQNLGRLWPVVKGLLEARAPNTVNIDDVKTKAWQVRNRAVHQGERIEPEAAEQAVALAASLVEVAMPEVLKSIGLNRLARASRDRQGQRQGAAPPGATLGGGSVPPDARAESLRRRVGCRPMPAHSLSPSGNPG
jgi:hypothetical protein